MYSFSLFPPITKPTRVTSTSATLIDNIFCNNILDKQSATGILNTHISDHLTIFYIDYSSNKSILPKFIKKRCFSPENIDKFKNECDSHNSNQVLESNDPQDAFTSFHNDFINLYDKCFPNKTIKLSYHKRKPWLTDGLRKSIKHENKLYRLKMKYNTPEYCTAYKHVVARSERSLPVHRNQGKQIK